MCGGAHPRVTSEKEKADEGQGQSEELSAGEKLGWGRENHHTGQTVHEGELETRGQRWHRRGRGGGGGAEGRKRHVKLAAGGQESQVELRQAQSVRLLTAMAGQSLCHNRLELGVGDAGLSLVSVLERQPVLSESGLELFRIEFSFALKVFTRGLLLP
jgi:hypothetical protein